MASVHRPRTRGRPVRLAHLKARESLLDAAVALFAEKGVAATTAVEIAARAGVTPALVHYYFRPRERLLDAVVDERLSRFVAHAVRALPALPAPRRTRHRPARRSTRMPTPARRMPWMPPIWIREIVSGGGLLRGRMIRHLPVHVITALQAALADGKRRGKVAHDIDPAFAFLSIAGATLFPLATRSLWSHFPGGGALSAARLRRHAHAMLSGGLTGPARRPARTSR